MTRLVAVVLLGASTVLGGPVAAADPRDWVPYCSGNQTPADDNCRPAPQQEPPGDAPGANPETPVGVNPGSEPLI
ncbi:hypothetical protein [uncultured Mycolicibacterium sp.]|uniref:hypothetical protein n=1 Tax=uncultured Mycolicibacterium sp. TaxID=2320817 RepID=UPI002601CFA1|nr:hypothetical protein [uncultured Mycolicibacterium sp.]